MTTDKQRSPDFLIIGMKGIAIGAANIIPGLSGGTIALITNVFERLIQGIKAVNWGAIQLLLCGRFREFAQRIDFFFLLTIFVGLLVGNVLLARLFDLFFRDFPSYTWSFFFGLVLASLYFVGKNVGHWSRSSIISLIFSSITALAITALGAAEANPAFWYLVLCGIIAICSMFLPGLSGSYVLILLGNYHLVAIEGLGNMRFDIAGPFFLGSVIGILAFAHVLGWLLKKYHSQTFASLCGFILGSLRSLWPWKEEIVKTFGQKPKVIGYQYLWPQWSLDVGIALSLCIAGIALIIFMEKLASKSHGQ